MTKTFTVKHNILEVDRCVFPGCESGIFHQPETWPQKVKDSLEFAWLLTKKYSVKLLKGEVDLEAAETRLEIEAESPDDIQLFYSEWVNDLTFLEITECIDCEEEMLQEIKSIKLILNAA